MTITYYGLSCFKIVTKPAGRATDDVTFFISPFDKKTGLRPPQGAADVVFVSHDSESFNNAKAMRGEPFVVDVPGEYALKGMQVDAFDAPADPKNGESRGNTVVYVIETEGMRVCHLGALGGELSAEQLDTIGNIDILFVPVGDKDGLDPKSAEKLCRTIEPKMIVPMHYKTKGSKLKLLDEKSFCAEIGNCPKEQLPKLIVKKADIETKSMEVVMFAPQ